MQETKETQVRALGWEDALEQEMATHSSILAWKIPWTEEPGRLQSMGLQRLRHNWAIEYAFYFKCPAESLTITNMFASYFFTSPPTRKLQGFPSVSRYQDPQLDKATPKNAD